MISLNMLCSDTFPTMPIKHLRRDYFVTRLKITICYLLIINTKHENIENFHHKLNLFLHIPLTFMEVYLHRKCNLSLIQIQQTLCKTYF